MIVTGTTPSPSPTHEVRECLAVSPETVVDVVERLSRLQVLLEGGPRGPDDGLACVNHLFLEVVREVLDGLGTRDRFRDPEFLSRLTVEFARRYFAAVRADAEGREPARSWRVLIDRRSDLSVGPMEFALAGANAHVNFDLAIAVVQACTVLGRTFPGPTEHADEQEIIAIFARRMCGLRDDFEHWLARGLDGTVVDRIRDDAGSLAVVLSRDSAWRRSESLWALRYRPAEFDEECAAIDWRVSMVGRGILGLAS